MDWKRDRVWVHSQGNLKVSVKQRNWILNFQFQTYSKNNNGKNWNSKLSTDWMPPKARVQKAISILELLYTKCNFMNKPAKHFRKAVSWMLLMRSCSTTWGWRCSKMKNIILLLSISKYAHNWTRSTHMLIIIWPLYTTCTSIRTKLLLSVIRPKSIYRREPIIIVIDTGLLHFTKKAIWPKRSKR